MGKNVCRHILLLNPSLGDRKTLSEGRRSVEALAPSRPDICSLTVVPYIINIKPACSGKYHPQARSAEIINHRHVLGRRYLRTNLQIGWWMCVWIQRSNFLTASHRQKLSDFLHVLQQPSPNLWVVRQQPESRLWGRSIIKAFERKLPGTC